VEAVLVVIAVMRIGVDEGFVTLKAIAESPPIFAAVTEAE
jgi:hypothetical protein